MVARKLQVVPEEAPMDVPLPASNVRAAAAGSYRDLLVALRDSIAGQIDEGIQARDLASLSRRLLEIAAELEALDLRAAEEGGGSSGNSEDEEFDAATI